MPGLVTAARRWPSRLRCKIWPGRIANFTLINPLEDKRTPFFLRDSQSDYDQIVKQAPELYKLGYDASDNLIPSAIADSALVLLLYEVMHDLVDTYKPDAIVTTYPLYQSALEAVFVIDRQFVPLYTVVTDLSTVHRIWFHKAATACLVPNQTVFDLAVASNLDPQKVIITGIPVSPRLNQETRSRAEIRRELGWDEKRVTILAVGSKRVDRLVETAETLNHSGYPVQLAVAAGKDAVLYENMKAIDWHIPAYLYEYVSNMPSTDARGRCHHLQGGRIDRYREPGLRSANSAGGCPTRPGNRKC